jgi:ABC-2 type transport system ATP-binding protein
VTEAQPIIETRGLVKRFSDVDAVAGIDLHVPSGGVYGFLGPNGAGKTTTIRILLALIRPTRGTSLLFGEPVVSGAAVLRRVGALVERPAFYPYLSALDNLGVIGRARSMAAPDIARRAPEALERVGLADTAKRKAGRFSTGMRQRLGIAAALLDRPELVILDEPTNGLDPSGVVDVRAIIAGLAKDGTTLFLSSHVLPEVEQLCDRVAILQHGRIIAEGATQAMLRVGERLFVRFDSAEDATRARTILEGLGPVDVDLGHGAAASPGSASRLESGDGRPSTDTALLVDTEVGGSEVVRRLTAAGIYPAELSLRRPSLESVFIELTAEHTAAAAGAAA